MADRFVPRAGWGPDRKRAALSLTFDNFGEAAEIEFGSWGDRPVGDHYTAAFVPRLVELLGNVRATYFVEASNAAIYPAELRSWRDAGHEIGLHGWRHESWENCPAERRRELLRQSLAAMRAIGLDPIGFRPPGGSIPAECWAEFEDVGLLYCSDLSTPGLSQVGRMISVPFEWAGVDSYRIEQLMAPVRQRNGDAEAPVDIAQWRAELTQAVEETVAAGSQRTIVFHPMFLAQSDEKLAVVEYLIALGRKADMWIAPVAEMALFAARELGQAEARAA